MSFTDTAKHWLWGCAVWTAANRSVVNVAMPHLRGKWSPTKAILRTLDVCCIGYSFTNRLPAPIVLWSLFDHADRDIHGQEGRGLPDESTPQRQNVCVIPSHRDSDQIAIADNAIGWIEIDPAGAWKVDLQPGVGGAAAAGTRFIRAGNENVSADEASGQTQGTRRFHHKNSEVPATSAACPQGFRGVLHAFRAASGVNEVLLDGQGHGAQQTHGAGGSRRTQELFDPLRRVLAWIVVLQRSSQVGKLIGRIAERITLRELLQWIIGQPDFEMFQGNDAFKAQLGSGTFESSHAHGVIEYIVKETKMSGFRSNLQTRLDKPQVVAFP